MNADLLLREYLRHELERAKANAPRGKTTMERVRVPGRGRVEVCVFGDGSTTPTLEQLVASCQPGKALP